MRINSETYQSWLTQLKKDINFLNSKTYDPVFGGDKFELGNRGRTHRIVLIKNDEVIAYGMRSISETMYRYLRKYK